MLQSLDCPKCGAPLPPNLKSGVVVCLYCNSSLRAEIDESETRITVENELDEQELAEVKRLIREGKREYAMERYRAFSGASEEDSEQAVNNIARQLTYTAVSQQQLSPFGKLLVVAWAALLVGGAYFGLVGKINAIFALILVGFSAFNLYFFLASIRTTLQFARAPIARAVTLKLAPIGVLKTAGREVHTFRAWLEVQPQGEEPFKAEMTLPVRQENLARAMPGVVIQVKYLKDPLRLIYHGRAK